MNKLLSLILALLVVPMTIAKEVTTPDDIPAYYASIDGTAGKSLFNALASVTRKGKIEIGYNGLYDAYKITDIYPADSTDKKGLVWDMYSNCGYDFDNTCGQYKNECDCYNREHSIPQSWWGGGTGQIGNDIFHVIPTDGKVNGVRNNYCYGEVAGEPNYTSLMGHKRGTGAAVVNQRPTICSAAGQAVPWGGGQKDYVFEPIDRYKGDLARGIMGTLISWQEDLTGDAGTFFFQSDFTASTNWGLTKYGVALLMKWHRQDPVSQKEIDRNNGIQATQGNRNPFIDYPYLAEYIWGEYATETVHMADLMASCEDAFIPGESDGWRTEPVDPDQPQLKHALKWSVDGVIIQIDSIRNNNKINALPESPESCSPESETFVGWTTVPIDGVTDTKPVTLYTAAKDIPRITVETVLYAVFAHVQTEGASKPATYTFSETDQTGWLSNAEWNGTYCLLVKSSQITSPVVELVGLKSIEINMRTYGGSDNNTVTISADNKQLATLTASNNKINPYAWTNTQTLSGNAALRFTADKSDKQGIGISKIVIDATGSTTVMSRFMTACDLSTDKNNTNGEPILQSYNGAIYKYLKSGVLYIVIDGKTYNSQGQRVE